MLAGSETIRASRPWLAIRSRTRRRRSAYSARSKGGKLDGSREDGVGEVGVRAGRDRQVGERHGLVWAVRLGDAARAEDDHRDAAVAVEEAGVGGVGGADRLAGRRPRLRGGTAERLE